MWFFCGFMNYFMKNFGKEKMAERLENIRGFDMGNISKFNAMGNLVWQKVYVAPHLVSGWNLNVFIAFPPY